MTTWDESCDLLIVGSGGASMCASLLYKSLGRQALICEKQSKIGGSTGYSGGVWWIPNNPVIRRNGVDDSFEKAWAYFDSVVRYKGRASNDARREAFLRSGPEMVDFLERQGMRFQHADGWSDYYDDQPGGQPRGRSLVAEVFDVNQLGEWKGRLSMYPGVALPLGSEDFPTLFLAKKTMAGKKMGMRLVWRLLKNKLFGRDVRGGGAAIQGRMLQIALREQLPIRTDTAVRDFVVEHGRVVGVVAVAQGREVRIRARDGVLINAGGFSRNREMRERWQPKPNAWKWTNANPGDTGEMIEAAMRLGAAVDCMNEAWWVITSLGPGETLPEGAVNPEGVAIPFMHHLDLSLPHLIMVDQDGRRFCDESGAYMEIGQRLYARHEQSGRGIPAWVILDSRHRENYPWGTAPPGKTPQSWLDGGYMKKADTLEELARLCGIDAAGLKAEVRKFNGYCLKGVDPEFNRGGRAFDRAHGDPTVKPNPNLGSIEQGPFYAVAMYPGDVGTAGGIVTDEHARVLREDGSVIDGLYATGNSTASVVGRCYPGAGASIGASFVFGYRAAQHAAKAAAPAATRQEAAA
jgi:3-oxosteroid 1-dehydrogenase